MIHNEADHLQLVFHISPQRCRKYTI